MDVSHGCFTGTGPQFDALRVTWAQVAGYGVTDYHDVGGPIMPNINYDAYSEGDTLGEWPNGAPDDPLLILLVHEEHCGRIQVCHMPYLADRLEQLVAVMMKSDLPSPSSVLMTQQFVRGLRTAAAYKQDVIFQ